MNTETLDHEDIAFLADSILKWAHEFVDLVKNDHTDENWMKRYELHLTEVMKYDEIIDSYKEKALLPRPDTCLHVEILYVIQIFTTLQKLALQMTIAQMDEMGHTSSDTYGALSLNVEMNIAIRWILSIERKMELRKANQPVSLSQILNEIAEEY